MNGRQQLRRIAPEPEKVVQLISFTVGSERFGVEIYLHHHMPVTEITEWLDLAGSVCDRDAFNPISIDRGNRMRHPDDKSKLWVQFRDSSADRFPVCSVFIQGPEQLGFHSPVLHSVENPQGVSLYLRKTAGLQVRDIGDIGTGARVMECKEFVGKHVGRLLLGIHDRHSLLPGFCKIEKSPGDLVLEITP